MLLAFLHRLDYENWSNVESSGILPSIWPFGGNDKRAAHQEQARRLLVWRRLRGALPARWQDEAENEAIKQEWRDMAQTVSQIKGPSSGCLG